MNIRTNQLRLIITSNIHIHSYICISFIHTNVQINPFNCCLINRVEFPPCVQWLTVEFDPQCGTAQLEDYLLVSVPKSSASIASSVHTQTSIEQSQCLDDADALDGFSSFDSETLGICKNARLTTTTDFFTRNRKSFADDEEWHVAQMFNKYKSLT